MLSVQRIFAQFRGKGISFYTGVPDSLLKDFCAYITDHTTDTDHVVAANEGSAVALAAGHYLATGEKALVYMQNSGIGNAANPLLSLADPDVYGIPMIVMVGWRGEPGRPDEPQHVKQGRIMHRLIRAMEIPYTVLDDTVVDATGVLNEACDWADKERTPYIILVRAGTFESYTLQTDRKSDYPLDREQAIKMIVDRLQCDDLVVSTTGKASRELFAYREARGDGHGNDFLTVGSMGHCSQIALGVALNRPDRHVYCIDGDGAVIMHMGGLGTIGQTGPRNFKHVVINNGAHDSVGGQPTAGFKIDLVAVSQASGYAFARRVETREELEVALGDLRNAAGPALLEIRVRIGARPDLGRPSRVPRQNRDSFMRHLLS